MRKILLLSLLLIVASALVACGGESSNAPSENNTEEPANEETVAEGSEEEAEEEVANEESEEESTNENSAQESEATGETDETEAGTFTTIHESEINETKETGPFIVTLEKVMIRHAEFNDMGQEMFSIPEGTVIGVNFNVENTSEDTWSIYPDQSILVTDTGKQVNAEVFLADEVGGDFLGQVTKTGVVPYILDEDAESIGSFRIVIDAPHDENLESGGEDIEFEVSL